MNDELIRKSEIIRRLKEEYRLQWNDDDEYVVGINDGLEIALHAVENMQPVNAVELPCKVDTKLYEPCAVCKGIHTQTVKGFSVSDRLELVNCEAKNYFAREIGNTAFFTREEAERALEELRNE